MKVTDEAVIAAAKAAYKLRPMTSALDEPLDWEDVSTYQLAGRIAEARAALEAGGPLLEMDALREHIEREKPSMKVEFSNQAVFQQALDQTKIDLLNNLADGWENPEIGPLVKISDIVLALRVTANVIARGGAA